MVAFIESLPLSLGPNDVKLRMAAIADHHAARHVASPIAHAAVRAALSRCSVVGNAMPPRVASCGEDLAGLRNRALLLLIQAGGLVPVDVAGLDREDLHIEEEALVLSVRAAAAPVERPGQAVRLPRRRGDPLCPAQALEHWLQQSGISYGPVFRAITVHGTLERRLGVVSVRRILPRIEKQAVAQTMPEGCKLVRGAWRKTARAKGATRAHSSNAPAKQRSIRKPGLRLDAVTANVEIRAWLRDVANRRVHATTGRIPADVLAEERGVLLPLASPWPGLVLRPAALPVAAKPTPRPPAPVIQHPLSIYEDLLAPRVLQ